MSLSLGFKRTQKIHLLISKEFQMFPSRITTMLYPNQPCPATNAEFSFQIFMGEMKTVVLKKSEFEHADK